MSPLQVSQPRPERVPRLGRGLPAAGAAIPAHAEPSGRGAGPGGGGAARGRRRHPSPGTGPAFPHPAGQGRRRTAVATPPRPPASLPRLSESRAVRPRRAPAAAGRGRAGNFAATGGAAPGGASASVGGGLRGAAAARETGERRLGARWPRRQRPLAEPAWSPNSGGAAPGSVRTARPPPRAFRCARPRIATPSVRPAAAAALADGRAAGAAAASPARAGPPSAGAGGRSRKGASGRPRWARSSRPPSPPALPARPVRDCNNGAERRREPRVRPAVVEEVARLRGGGQGDAPRRPLAGVCLRAGPLRPPAPDSPPDRRRQLDPGVWCQRPG